MLRFVVVLLAAMLPAVAAKAQAARPVAHPLNSLQVVDAGIAARDPDLIAAIYADQVTINAPQGVRRFDRAGIRAVWVDNFANGYSSLATSFAKSDLRGNHAILAFLFRAGIRPDGQAEFDLNGRYLIGFTRQPGGGWLVTSETWSLLP